MSYNTIYIRVICQYTFQRKLGACNDSAFRTTVLPS